MLTKRQRRAAKKRARKIAIAGGGYTSAKRAAEYMREETAALNPAGELVFDPRRIHHAEPDVLRGASFEWKKGTSDHVIVWKGRARLTAAA